MTLQSWLNGGIAVSGANPPAGRINPTPPRIPVGGPASAFMRDPYSVRGGFRPGGPGG